MLLLGIVLDRNMFGSLYQLGTRTVRWDRVPDISDRVPRLLEHERLGFESNNSSDTFRRSMDESKECIVSPYGSCRSFLDI
jgi:hypothetical protein